MNRVKRLETDEKPEYARRLYEVFAPYPASSRTMGACSHCVTRAEVESLFAVPLPRLTAENLRRYAGKAMTTWGEADEWKHFLPRLCELSWQRELDFDWTRNKFSMVEWREWPANETQAVRDFWREFTVSIARSSDWFDLDGWLKDLSGLGETGEAELHKWLSGATVEEILDLDAWTREWGNMDSRLAKWTRQPEIENQMLARL